MQTPELAGDLKLLSRKKTSCKELEQNQKQYNGHMYSHD